MTNKIIVNNTMRTLFTLSMLVVCTGALGVSLVTPTGIYWQAFGFYTILSNILVFFVYVYQFFICIKNLRGKKTEPSAWIKGWGLVTISITMLVVMFILEPARIRAGAPPDGLRVFLLHYVIPAGVVADWVLFDEHGRVKNSYPFTWLVSPLVYFFYSIILAESGFTFISKSGEKRSFAYFFIDIYKLSTRQIIINILLFTGAIVLLGYGYVKIDRAISKRPAK